MVNDIKTDIFYNYVYLDPRKPGDYNYGDLHFDYEPFYIGKGKNNRCYSHLKQKNKSYKINKIKKIQNFGLEPVILKIYENLSEEESLINENNLIQLIGRHDKKLGPLVNLTDGGEKNYGYIYSKEQLIQMSINRMGDKNAFYGKHHTEETLKNMSESRRGKYDGNKNPMYNKHHNLESLKIMSESKQGKYDGDKNPRAKKIYLYDLDFNFYKEYSTSKEFADVCNINNSYISHIINYNMKQLNENSPKFKKIRGYYIFFNKITNNNEIY